MGWSNLGVDFQYGKGISFTHSDGLSAEWVGGQERDYLSRVVSGRQRWDFHDGWVVPLSVMVRPARPEEDNRLVLEVLVEMFSTG